MKSRKIINILFEIICCLITLFFITSIFIFIYCKILTWVGLIIYIISGLLNMFFIWTGSYLYFKLLLLEEILIKKNIIKHNDFK